MQGILHNHYMLRVHGVEQILNSGNGTGCKRFPPPTPHVPNRSARDYYSMKSVFLRHGRKGFRS